jgi:hypothetical protein
MAQYWLIEDFESEQTLAQANWTIIQDAYATVSLSTDHSVDGTRAMKIAVAAEPFSWHTCSAAYLVGLNKKWNLQFAIWIAAYCAGTEDRVGYEPTLNLMDGATIQGQIVFGKAGTMRYYKNSVLIGTSTNTPAIATGSWHNVEVAVSVDHTAAGTLTIFLDGVSCYTYTGITSFSGNDYADGFQFVATGASGIGATPIYYIDNPVVRNDPALITQLGPQHIASLVATGAGDLTQWTPLTGTNFSQVNEAIADGDTSYVGATAVGNRDAFPMTSVAALSGAILCVAVDLVARDDLGGGAQVAAVVKVAGGATYDQAGQATSASYLRKQTVMTTDPATGVNWLMGDIASRQFGYKKAT